MNNVRPCTFPGCDRDNGDPQLTDLGMCEPCQRRYRLVIQRLVAYWAYINANLPAPPARDHKIRTSLNTAYGHPREWASDHAADIAAKLYWTHDALAEYCGDAQPPSAGRERHRAFAARDYLIERLDRLATMPGAEDAAQELETLYRATRSGLGLTRADTALTAVPCMTCLDPNLWLTAENVECRTCQRVYPAEQFGFLARHAVAAALDDWRKRNTECA